ncbi:hypothetical protein [Frankia sp. CiP3]|uniref:hypothetical protein n=1 Tax=Frankia sp. CiP3 TaxID=2880971 RepID=UPI001EF5F066|nr:hypothetical protein [Frankia sp. CiP3]
MSAQNLPRTAAALRAYALAVLARDAAYDRHPHGDPVLLTTDMRRGLHAALITTPPPLHTSGPATTAGERTAFHTGVRAALDAVHTAVATALGPDQLRNHRRVRTRQARPCTPIPRTAPPALDLPGGDTSTPLGLGPLLVLDGDGTLLSPFDPDAWTACHAWAHAQTGQPGIRLPVQIDDPRNRQTWQITPTRCTHILWLPDDHPSTTYPCPLLPGPRPADD